MSRSRAPPTFPRGPSRRVSIVHAPRCVPISNLWSVLMPSNVDEFTWVSDPRLDVPDPDGAMTDRARMALVNHMSAAIDRPGRRLPWLIAATAVAGGAAGAVVLAVGVGAGSAPHRSGSATPVASLAQQPVRPSFVLLPVARRAAQTPALPGNATLVKRSTDVPTPGRAPTVMTGYDLYQDNGDYYYGQTLAALRSAASDPSPSDKQAAPFGQITAAAAASADLTPAQAADKLLAADPHPTPKVGHVDTTEGKPFTWTQAAVDRDLDGIEWLSISSALEGGAGKPQVRAGALRAAAAMPNTTVTSTTHDGEPAVAITWHEGPGQYVESLTVDSQTGVLLLAHDGGSPTGVTSTTTYDVSRVTAPSLTAAH